MSGWGGRSEAAGEGGRRRQGRAVEGDSPATEGREGRGWQSGASRRQAEGLGGLSSIRHDLLTCGCPKHCRK